MRYHPSSRHRLLLHPANPPHPRSHADCTPGHTKKRLPAAPDRATPAMIPLGFHCHTTLTQGSHPFSSAPCLERAKSRSRPKAVGGIRSWGGAPRHELNTRKCDLCDGPSLALSRLPPLRKMCSSHVSRLRYELASPTGIVFRPITERFADVIDLVRDQARQAFHPTRVKLARLGTQALFLSSSRVNGGNPHDSSILGPFSPPLRTLPPVRAEHPWTGPLSRKGNTTLVAQEARL